jgi:DNA-binding NtrC family response regulator
MNNSSNSVLIVNSEPDVSSLLAEMLLMDDEKYIINVAHSGFECMETIKRYKPDLILLDIELSDMDGWELIDSIKKIHPDIPFITITGKSPELDDFSRIYHVSDYLMKPVTIDGLHMAVKDALKVPEIFNKCIEKARNSGNRNEHISILEKNIAFIRQTVADRKAYVLMKQLYSDKKLKDNTKTKKILDNLKKKIDKAYDRMEALRNREISLNIKI